MARKFLPYQIVKRDIIKKYRKQLWNPFITTIKRYALVGPDDKIAVHISGGKNSMLMAKLFQELHRHSDAPLEVIYLVMDPGHNEVNRAKIENNAKLLNISTTIFETDILDVTNSADKYPCYLCARMRRGHLYRKAEDLGCDKITLSHRLNDMIETTVMTMFYNSQLQGMIPKLYSRDFEGMELIRPMYCIRKGDIIAQRCYNELSFIQCVCRFTESCTICNNDDGGSKRQEVKILLHHLKQTNPNVERSIFSAIHIVYTETFPGIRKSDDDHSFLEDYEARRGE